MANDALISVALVDAAGESLECAAGEAVAATLRDLRDRVAILAGAFRIVTSSHDRKSITAALCVQPTSARLRGEVNRLGRVSPYTWWEIDSGACEADCAGHRDHIARRLRGREATIVALAADGSAGLTLRLPASAGAVPDRIVVPDEMLRLAAAAGATIDLDAN